VYYKKRMLSLLETARIYYNKINMESEFRRLPSVDKVLSDERIERLAGQYLLPLLLGMVRRKLETVRESITAGDKCPPFDEIVESIRSEVEAMLTPTLRPVINASGVLLHTNLGRAPLSKEARTAMEAVSKGYCNLEFDLDSGKRGQRNQNIEPMLRELTGAEAALVVNNNASAVMFGLTAFTKRKEVIVSRGQAVQIGGGFRIPDVMRQSGAKLVEVGTTNCTYIADYERALGPKTGALLRVHSSNFKQIGFTDQITIEELVALGSKNQLPVFDDLGSGCFLDTTEFGLDPEPMVQHSIAAGASLVFFSGDKLMGGPQAGIIVGKKEYVDKLKRHPLMRALRTDKVRMAGISVTLTHYLRGEALTKIPVWRMISTPPEEIDRRARIWQKSFGETAEVIDGESMVGGGSLPGATLPTRLLAIRTGRGKRQNTAQILNEKLRRRDVPVIGRVNEDNLLLDPRSVFPEEDYMIVKALAEIAAGLK